MKRAIIFAFLVPIAGGLVGVLGDASLHGAADDVFPQASLLSFALGCVWGIVPAVVCGLADWLLETRRFRILAVAASAFGIGLLPMATIPGIDLRWMLAAGCLTAIPAALCSWVSGSAA